MMNCSHCGAGYEPSLHDYWRAHLDVAPVSTGVCVLTVVAIVAHMILGVAFGQQPSHVFGIAGWALGLWIALLATGTWLSAWEPMIVERAHEYRKHRTRRTYGGIH